MFDIAIRRQTDGVLAKSRGDIGVAAEMGRLLMVDDRRRLVRVTVKQLIQQFGTEVRQNVRRASDVRRRCVVVAAAAHAAADARMTRRRRRGISVAASTVDRIGRYPERWRREIVNEAGLTDLTAVRHRRLALAHAGDFTSGSVSCLRPRQAFGGHANRPTRYHIFRMIFVK